MIPGQGTTIPRPVRDRLLSCNPKMFKCSFPARRPGSGVGRPHFSIWNERHNQERNRETKKDEERHREEKERQREKETREKEKSELSDFSQTG